MRKEDDTETNHTDSWMAWFKNKKDAPIINRFHKETLFKTFGPDISDERCKSQLIK